MQTNHKKILIWSVVVVLVIIIASAALAYATSFRDPVTVSLKRLYPHTVIGSSVISVNDVEQAQIIGQSFGLTKEQAKQDYIDYLKALVVAKKFRVVLNSDSLADEYLYYTKGNESEYKSLLASNFQNSDRLFYKYFVAPQLISAKLRIKYYTETKNNSPAYAQALVVLDKLKQKQSFEDLAIEYSEDESTASIGGDLGFYEHGQILPELDDQISISTMGEPRQDVVISRIGYHVLYPVEQVSVHDVKHWHAKHILLTNQGYDKWIEDQLNAVSVFSIVR